MKRIVVITIVVATAFGLALLVASAVSSDAPTTTVALSTSTTTSVTSGTLTTAGTTTTTEVLASTTTTSLPTTTTSTTTTTTTTTSPPPPAGNHSPTVSIASPPHLSSHQEARFDTSTGRFGAAIEFSAVASDADGDSITVRWYSSIEGYLGSGAVLTATIHTQGSDSTQPFITARATDQWGVATEATIQIIVSIPSG